MQALYLGNATHYQHQDLGLETHIPHKYCKPIKACQDSTRVREYVGKVARTSFSWVLGNSPTRDLKRYVDLRFAWCMVNDAAQRVGVAAFEALTTEEQYELVEEAYFEAFIAYSGTNDVMYYLY